jgi:hypothetical protein
MPEPHWLHAAGKARALLFRKLATWSGVSLGLAENISAATPLTTGVAIEVPMYDA